jgi:serine/threonine protein kinase
VLRTVNHENVIRLYGAKVESDGLRIVTELMPRSLEREVTQRAAFGPAKAWTYLSQIAAGMQHLHSLRFAHCDLWPPNILVACPCACLKCGQRERLRW